MSKSQVKVWIYVALVSLLMTSLLPLSYARAAVLDKPQISAGSLYTIGLRQDGTVVGTGDNSDGQRNVGDWSSIVYVAAGVVHTVGVYQNGEVVATGRNNEGQCNVGGWSNISQVAVGWAHTVGLKKDGTVVAVGANKHGELNVGGWSDIVQVAADDYWSQGKRVSSHTIGVKSDGTVVAVGANTHGQLDVSGWSDIVQVAAGGQHTVGLKSDGTVVAVGDNEHGKINVSGWSNIVYVAAGDFHTLGVKDNGRVVSVGANFIGQRNVGGWRDIIQVDGGRMHSVGVKLDGTVVATGLNAYRQCNVSSWDLTSAYDQGYQAGYQAGYNAGYQDGREDGYEWGYRDAKLETDIQAVACRLGEPPPSEDGSIREINLDIRFENQGCGDAFSAYGYVISVPDGVTVPQSFAWIGDIPAGSSIWSDNPITIRVDTANPPDPSEGIVWYVEYMDADYNYRYIEDLIQSIDITPPEISCPADVTLECPADTSPTNIGEAVATDDSGDVTITYADDVDGGTGNTVTITRTWKATDGWGNAVSCDQIITVVDTTPPSITCPADVTVEQETTAGTIVPLTATATDNCDLSPVITSDELPIYPVGTTTVTFTATDDCGNSSSCSMTITVLGPPDIKETAKSCLSLYVDESKRIDKAVDEIDKSLDSKYWIDKTHLDCKHGNNVFDYEHYAVKQLMYLLEGIASDECDGIASMTLEYSGGAGSSITVDKGTVTDNGGGTYTIAPEDGKDKLSSNTKVYVGGVLSAEIHTSCSKPIDIGDVHGDFVIYDLDKLPKGSKKNQVSDEALACAQETIATLVEVDRILAETLIIEAEGTLVVDPKNQDKVDKELAKAHKELDKGDADRDAGKPDEAIEHYGKAWEHACHTLKEATKT